MDLLYTILVFIVVIGVLVVVHEFGHFIAARLSGMRVEVFAVGMGKRLFGWNKIGGFSFGDLPDDWDGGDHTDYRVCLLPIGGYVKISGMVDESMDSEQIASEPKPWEFRSKSAWKKAFAISAGVIMNILLAIAIYSFVAFHSGKTLVNTTTIAHVEHNSPTEKIGLQAGDKVLRINNESVHSWNDVLVSLTLKKLGDNRVITVLRGSSEISLNVNGKEIIDAMANQQQLGLIPEGTFVAFNAVETMKPAGKLGLLEGDTVLAVNGIRIFSVSQFVENVKKNANTPITLDWKRGASMMSAQITPDNSGRIGVGIEQGFNGATTTLNYGVIESLSIGVGETWHGVEMFYSTFAQIFKQKIAFDQAMGGPIMIAKTASRQAQLGFLALIQFMAMLSVSLAVINILPFPALDGGHLVFIIIEGIMRREVSVKVKMAFQQVGMIILLLFMAYVFYIDIMRR